MHLNDRKLHRTMNISWRGAYKVILSLGQDISLTDEADDETDDKESIQEPLADDWKNKRHGPSGAVTRRLTTITCGPRRLTELNA
jgi:hypothetical protein